MPEAASIYDLTCEDITGKKINLSDYRWQVMLIVNVASKCGFTPQYAKLEKLYQKHKDSGLVVLGFPCNQFARQEPGDAKQICKITDKYHVSFPMFAKTEVIGDEACPLYKYLRKNLLQKTVMPFVPWNFTKLLVGRDGKVLRRFLPWSRFSAIEAALRKVI